MAKNTLNNTGRTSANLRTGSHRRAQIAASLAGESLVDFVSDAVDSRAEPILRKHKVKLPEDAEPVSQAA